MVTILLCFRERPTPISEIRIIRVRVRKRVQGFEFDRIRDRVRDTYKLLYALAACF